jgi:hypothetical protein
LLRRAARLLHAEQPRPEGAECGCPNVYQPPPGTPSAQLEPCGLLLALLRHAQRPAQHPQI